MERMEKKEEERLELSSNLIAAYLMNLGKAAVLIAGLVGAFYFVQYILGQNPFLDVFETLGIPLVWALRALYGIIAAYFVIIIFSTLSLTSYELVLKGDMVRYSYGSFFKVSRETKAANIVRMNYKEYSPLSIGEIEVELTGTEEKKVKVQYVSDVKEKCERINQLTTLKKSEELDAVKAEGEAE